MNAVLETGADFEPSFRVAEEGSLKDRLKSAAILGGTSLLAFEAQRYGWDSRLPIGLRQIAESCAHPLLGYIGAWFGTEVVTGRSSEIAEDVAFAAATAVNFATETAQDIIIPTTEAAKWYHHPLETSKDYLFALGGAAIFFHQNRKTRE